MRRPPAGAKSSRKNAKALTTIELAVAPTPKLCANCGSTGRISPNPSAMTNADATSTHSSRGMRTAAEGWVTGVADTIHQYAVRPRQLRTPRPAVRPCAHRGSEEAAEHHRQEVVPVLGRLCRRSSTIHTVRHTAPTRSSTQLTGRITLHTRSAEARPGAGMPVSLVARERHAAARRSGPRRPGGSHRRPAVRRPPYASRARSPCHTRVAAVPRRTAVDAGAAPVNGHPLHRSRCPRARCGHRGSTSSRREPSRRREHGRRAPPGQPRRRPSPASPPDDVADRATGPKPATRCATPSPTCCGFTTASGPRGPSARGTSAMSRMPSGSAGDDGHHEWQRAERQERCVAPPPRRRHPPGA